MPAFGVNEHENLHRFSSNLKKVSKTIAYIAIDHHESSVKDQTNLQTVIFRKHFYPNVSLSQWNDWRWQLRNRILNKEGLEKVVRLSKDEIDGIQAHKGALPLSITPYYLSLIDRIDPSQPIRRSVIPVNDEFLRNPGEADDPLAEDTHTPVPCIVHRYPDRVLFLVTNYCSTYCRYCTRSRMIGINNKTHLDMDIWENAIAYIEKTPTIRDVLISGGDPLTLSDERLDWLLSRLRLIPHVELLRIGTKVPAVLPQRITLSLLKILKKYHPLWISIHAIHPDEITPEMSKACISLADSGIPLGSQTVLLSGINDDVETMKKLVHGLVKIRVKPYYLYQCDPVSGSAHFRTSVKKGLEIIKGLRGYTTGYAVPTYVIDAPGGGGKIPIFPETIIGRDGENLLLKNYEGRTYTYPDYGAINETIFN
ncbi:KamA family radical SAM protein [bacterium]|nr:KamA family radical SAM protein [bacterium]